MKKFGVLCVVLFALTTAFGQRAFNVPPATGIDSALNARSLNPNSGFLKDTGIVFSGTPTATNDIGVTISITDDGNHAETETLFVPTLKAKGVVGCIAVQTRDNSNWGTGFTPSECLELVSDGFEIISHSMTHAVLLSTSNTLETIEYELSNSKSIIESAGITCNNFAWPEGKSDFQSRKLARKYYRSAGQTEYDIVGLISNPDRGIIVPPIPTYKLPRIYLSTISAENLTNLVDSAVAMGNCHIEIYSHAVFAVSEFGSESAYTDFLGDFIDYALSQGCEFVTVDDALDRIGNVVDYGDYQAFKDVDPNGTNKRFSDENEHFVLGINGVASSTFSGGGYIENYGYMTAGATYAHSASDSITNYPAGKISVEQYNSSDASSLGWPGAGTVLTWRLSTPSTSPNGNGWQYQMFYAYDSTKVYRREWRGVSSWGGWDAMRAGVENIGTYAYTANLGTFTAGQTKRFVIDTTGTIDIISLDTPVLVAPERFDSTGTSTTTSGIQFHAYVYSPSADEIYLDVTSSVAKTYSNRVFRVTVLDPIE